MFIGRNVCKSFFRRAVGIRKQSFDQAVKEVLSGVPLCTEIKDRKENPLSERCATLRAFFRLHFKDNFGVSVEHDPTTERINSQRVSFLEIYEKDYVPYFLNTSESVGEKPLSYSYFTAFRKKYFPNYCISQTFKRKGT